VIGEGKERDSRRTLKLKRAQYRRKKGQKITTQSLKAE
jgi:hypothetical protein